MYINWLPGLLGPRLEDTALFKSNVEPASHYVSVFA